MYDGLYTEELINCAMLFLPWLMAGLMATFGEMSSDLMDFLEKILGLLSFSNQRAMHNNIAAFVANKAGMWNHVLSKLQVPPKTAQMLKNSTFTSEGVFGELPQAFLN